LRDVEYSVELPIGSRLESTELVVVVEMTSAVSTEVELREVVDSVELPIGSRLESTELVVVVKLSSAVSTEVEFVYSSANTSVGVAKFANPVNAELSNIIHKNTVKIFELISSFSFGISDFVKT